MLVRNVFIFAFLPQVFSLPQFSSLLEHQRPYRPEVRELVGELVRSLEENFILSHLFVNGKDEDSWDWGGDFGAKGLLQEKLIPTVLFGKSPQIRNTSAAASLRHSALRLAHVNALQTDSKGLTKPDPTWRLSYSTLLGPCLLKSHPRGRLHYDYFINIRHSSSRIQWDLQLSSKRDRRGSALSTAPPILWIHLQFDAQKEDDNKLSLEATVTSNPTQKLPSNPTQKLPSESPKRVWISCDDGACCDETEAARTNGTQWSPILNNLKGLDFAVVPTKNSRIKVKRHINPGPKGGTLLKSLVFLARKRFSSVDEALKPLNLFTSIVIIVGSSGIAVVLALMKMLTSGPDQTWYDYLIQQVLELVQEARAKRVPRGGADEEEPEGKSIQNGKLSRAVIHGTIQVVSFILVAIYEGKLYSTITLPKSRFISTFDELLTNNKYAIRFSKEAADVSLILGSRNLSVMNRFSQSFNIDDCIKWAERSVSHGCLAYDFELGNLPKAQKSKMLQEDKFFARTKTSIMARRKLSFHPAAQISRWILEAGFFQFWMLAESVFTDSLLSSSKLSAHKLFSIRDYLGLLVVYVFLLFLATLVFFSEFLAAWIRPFLEEKSLREMGRVGREWVRGVVWKLRVMFGAVKVFVRRWGKCWSRVRRIVNVV